MTDPTRIVCWFSCGAASAVATKLTIQDNDGRLPLVVAYTEVLQEHPDIELPAMYKLGYKNNNCIGCVKGGAGYWNKIRRDFPEAFEKMALVEEELGRTINQTRVGGERKRITLRELDPNAGRYEDEADISCGVVCNGISDRIFMHDLA